MKVQFSPSARNQFFSALSYIKRDKPSAAINFRNKAETILRRLETLPESDREVIVSPYRFFYKIKGNIVWIVAVWHGAQLPKEPKP